MGCNSSKAAETPTTEMAAVTKVAPRISKLNADINFINNATYLWIIYITCKLSLTYE